LVEGTSTQKVEDMAQGGGPDKTRRQELSEATLDHLADVMAGPREGGPGTHNYNSAFAEFTRRQTVAQQEAAKAQTVAARAQQEAAEAAKETARYIRQNAFYLLASAMALTLSSITTVALSVWSLWGTIQN
jgi:hypothetical protein